MRPSEMVDGLDAVAKRSERQEQVERMKQRSGRIVMNEAIHVDERGRRWQRIVLVGVIGIVAVTAGLFFFLMYLANSGGVSAQEAARDTRALLAQYTNLICNLDPLPAGKDLTVEELKQKLVSSIQEEIRMRNETLERTDRGRLNDKKTARKAIALLEKALTFQDGYGNPFTIERKERGVFIIKSSCAPDAFTQAQVRFAPVTAEKSL